eukprot:m.112785 g.112785  ORF g.112785 m.112785 type:complete len:81 (-) comp14103_c0_seq3:131-373(-)
MNKLKYLFILALPLLLQQSADMTKRLHCAISCFYGTTMNIVVLVLTELRYELTSGPIDSQGRQTTLSTAAQCSCQNGDIR